MTAMQRPIMSNDTKKSLAAFFGLLLLLLTLFYSLLARADAPPSTVAEPGAAELARALFEAVQAGKWWPAAALFLSLLVLGLRKLGPRFLPDGAFKAFLVSKKGGVVTTIVLAVLGGVVHALTAGMPFGFDWLETVVKVALTAMGGFVGLKTLLFGSAPPVPATAQTGDTP